MFTQTHTTFVMVSQQAEEIITLGRKRHWRFRIIPDFYGVIDGPIISANGDWLYSPLTDEDRRIIPKAAFSRHAAVRKAGYRIAQVVIGHEIKPMPDESFAAPNPKPEIDWGNVARVTGRGLAVVMIGIAAIPLAAFTALTALTGAVLLADPSYCIVLDDDQGTVVELLRWNTEVSYAPTPLKV
jgi:hypothetical protein